MGKFLAARCSSERPGPFRDNAGSHCPLHGSWPQSWVAQIESDIRHFLQGASNAQPRPLVLTVASARCG